VRGGIEYDVWLVDLVYRFFIVSRLLQRRGLGRSLDVVIEHMSVVKYGGNTGTRYITFLAELLQTAPYMRE
jgi:hypothetical protein